MVTVTFENGDVVTFANFGLALDYGAEQETFVASMVFVPVAIDEPLAIECFATAPLKIRAIQEYKKVTGCNLTVAIAAIRWAEKAAGESDEN